MTPDPPPDPLRRVTTCTYDGRGRVVSAVDPPGSVTWTTYDAPGPPAPAPEEPPDEPHIVE